MNIHDPQNKDKELSQEFHRKPRFIVTPWYLYEDKNLNSRLRELYSIILGFADGEDGYCYASDKYFEKLLGVSLRQTERDMKKLEDLSYIRRDTTQNGMKKTRKIFVIDDSNNFYNRQRCFDGTDRGEGEKKTKKPSVIDDSNNSYNRHGCRVGTDMGVGTTNIASTNREKNIYKKDSPQKKETAKFTQVGDYGHVKLTEKQYEEAVKLWGAKTMLDMFTNMDLYCESSGHTYKNYLATMIAWRKKDPQCCKSTTSTDQSNQGKAIEFISSLEIPSDVRIEFFSQDVEIRDDRDPNSPKVFNLKYEEKGFMGLLKDHIKKLKI